MLILEEESTTCSMATIIIWITGQCAIHSYLNLFSKSMIFWFSHISTHLISKLIWFDKCHILYRGTEDIWLKAIDRLVYVQATCASPPDHRIMKMLWLIALQEVHRICAAQLTYIDFDLGNVWHVIEMSRVRGYKIIVVLDWISLICYYCFIEHVLIWSHIYCPYIANFARPLLNFQVQS